MIRRRLLLGLLWLALSARGAPPLVVLVSLDGFRWDYLEKYREEAPQLRRLAAEGVRAERLIPCFPTQTFPNHYSIATGLRPVGDSAAGLVERRRRAAAPHVRVWLREAVPARLHYRDNPRIPPVILLADEGWEIRTRAEAKAWKHPERGEHGYDNELGSMGAVFIAGGPAFRRGAVIAPVENIQIYNLLCAVLGLRPSPNDGDDRLAAAALAPAAGP